MVASDATGRSTDVEHRARDPTLGRTLLPYIYSGHGWGLPTRPQAAPLSINLFITLFISYIVFLLLALVPRALAQLYTSTVPQLAYSYLS
jgi:hypothetical protein